MNAKLLFVHTLSPLHAGTGQGVGVIDLPIAREKATNLPYLPGSSLKGVLREACTNKDTRAKTFGPETSNASDHAGAVHFTDQRLLLMPIRSLAGTFAWVTSPFVLRRFLRDIEMVKGADFPSSAPEIAEKNECLVAQGTALKAYDEQVILEDIPLSPNEIADANAWAEELAAVLFPDSDEWKKIFKARFCIVHDAVFGFLVETATEVVARIALEDDKKTVKKGALWYEESLPAESVLSGLVVAAPVEKADINRETIFSTIEKLVEKPLQIGGNATVGRGLCLLRILPEEKKSQEETK